LLPIHTRKRRAKQTQHKKEKNFGDYDWQKLVEERRLDMLTVYEHNTRIAKRNKLDKIKLIIVHHESGKSVLSQTPVESDTDDSSDSTNSDYIDIDELHSQDSLSHSESSSVPRVWNCPSLLTPKLKYLSPLNKTSLPADLLLNADVI